MRLETLERFPAALTITWSNTELTSSQTLKEGASRRLICSNKGSYRGRLPLLSAIRVDSRMELVSP